MCLLQRTHGPTGQHKMKADRIVMRLLDTLFVTDEDRRKNTVVQLIRINQGEGSDESDKSVTPL